VIGITALTQPVVLFRTVRFALYAPTAVFAGTVMLIGLATNAAFTTSASPAKFAAALKSILYWSGCLS